MAIAISSMIMMEEDRQAGQGKELYKRYFVNITFYAKFRNATDTILIAEGYSNCIISDKK